MSVGKKYKLNDLKEIIVKDSFLTLEEDIRGCQDDEPFDDCTTRNYVKALTKICGCFPFHLKLETTKVYQIIKL